MEFQSHPSQARCSGLGRLSDPTGWVVGPVVRPGSRASCGSLMVSVSFRGTVPDCFVGSSTNNKRHMLEEKHGTHVRFLGQISEPGIENFTCSAMEPCASPISQSTRRGVLAHPEGGRWSKSQPFFAGSWSKSQTLHGTGMDIFPTPGQPPLASPSIPKAK